MDNNFDPDAYLAQKAPDTSFDPDAYLAEKQTPAESFGRGLLRNVPGAQQAVAAAAPYTHGLSIMGQDIGAAEPTYSGEMQHETKTAEQGKAQNPGAYGAGAVAATVAPAFIPVLGEAIEGSPIIANGIMGAAQSLSDANLTKNPVQNLEKAGTGAAIGAGTAYGLGKLLGNAPENLEGAANRAAVKSGNINRGFLGHLDKDEVDNLGDFMREHGLVNSDARKSLEQAQLIKQAYGQAIGESGAGATALKDPGEFIRQLSAKAANYQGEALPGVPDDISKMANTYNNGIYRFIRLGKEPTYDDLQMLKSNYGDIAFNSDHTVANPAAADIYFTLRDAMKSIVKDAPEKYGKILKGYSLANEVVNGLTKKVGAETGGSQGIGALGMGRILRQLPAPVRAVAGTTAAMTDHPYLAAMSALPEIMDPALHSKVLGAAAKALPKITEPAKLALTNFLSSKFGQGEK